MLEGKTVIVGVCGGIAAYKVVDLVSRIKKLGACVHVIMTENATKFVAPLTFQSISHNSVVSNMFEEPCEWDIKHISLAKKADLVVVAPATANIIGKIASGIADDMLSTMVMATKAPVLFVPAMNNIMYENPILQENILKLGGLGYLFMEPDTGPLAEEGCYGKGRLPEPAAIIEYIKSIVNSKRDMEGIRVLVTAGPTREAIDPVRYITNRSSGKMGYAVADAAARRGAGVLLISGPVAIQKPYNVELVNVISAMDMYNEVMKNYARHDVLIMVAAVADYRCMNIADRKIKKTDADMNIDLVKNQDIAKEVGKVKGDRILVGTCAETDDLLKNAREKLESKNLDFIVANDVTQEGAGFEVDTNIVKILQRDGTIIELPIMKKTEVAEKILDEVLKLLKNEA